MRIKARNSLLAQIRRLHAIAVQVVFADLRRVMSPSMRWRLYRKATTEHGLQKSLVITLFFWLIIFGFVLSFAGAIAGLLTFKFMDLLFFNGNLDSSQPLFVGSTVGMFQFCLVVAIVAHWHGTVRQAIRNRMERIGCVFCLGCGYDLRGQTENRCPECGLKSGHQNVDVMSVSTDKLSTCDHQKAV